MDIILTVIDFKTDTQRVITETRKYAEAFNARVILVNLEPLLPGAGGATEEELTTDLKGSYGDEIQAIHDLGENLTASGIENRILLIEGAESDQLLKEAEREEVDLIIIASKPHGAIVEALTHGLREQLAKYGHCPVLLVPVD
jgi:nucleotide-binding universal stress UspA family protein